MTRSASSISAGKRNLRRRSSRPRLGEPGRPRTPRPGLGSSRHWRARAPLARQVLHRPRGEWRSRARSNGHGPPTRSRSSQFHASSQSNIGEPASSTWATNPGNVSSRMSRRASGSRGCGDSAAPTFRGVASSGTSSRSMIVTRSKCRASTPRSRCHRSRSPRPLHGPARQVAPLSPDACHMQPGHCERRCGHRGQRTEAT